MLNWRYVNQFEQRSTDRRFLISPRHNKELGNHWVLADNGPNGRYRKFGSKWYQAATIFACKIIAEDIAYPLQKKQKNS